MGSGFQRRDFLRHTALAAAGAVVAAGAGTLGQVASVAAASGSAAPGAQAMSYKEAPLLAAQVKAGKLPSVEQRLPSNPRVLTPLEMVGQYGGTWHRAYKGLSDRVGPGKLQEEQLIEWNAPDPSTIGLVANAIEKWDQNDDASEYTFYLRSGLKWSDGTPVTGEDIRFFVEDMQMNPDIVPAPNFTMRQKINGEWVNSKVTVIDDTTFKVKYPASYPLLPIFFAKSGGGVNNGPAFLAPSKYLKQFHPKYTSVDTLNALAASKSLPGWQALWGEAGNMQGPAVFWFTNPDVPLLTGWRTTSPAPNDPHVMERNPYYWQVDTQGNQLPYIDKIEHALFDNTEVLNLWVAQGKINEQGRHMDTGSYTFYKENEAKGKYRVLNWRAASTGAYFPNQNAKDPVLATLFATPDFRQALNIAINRDEINQTVWNGLGTSRQASPITGSPEFDPEFVTKWAEYDPDTANALLDGLGLKRGADGVRVRSDGKPLEFIVEHTSGTGSKDLDQHEFVRRYWAAIGVKATMNYVERSLYEEHVHNGDVEVGYWGFDRLSVIKADPGRWTATIDDGPWAPLYGHFYSASPYAKAEPPADHWIRKIWNLWEQTQQTADEATRNATFQQIIDIHKQAPNVVGIVGEMVSPFIVSTNFRNFLGGFIADDTLRDDGLLNPVQFFIQQS